MKYLMICLYWWLVPISVSAAPNIELLASSCAACHGTNGHSRGQMPSLAGLDQYYFINRMKAFANGEATSTVMYHHAGAYTEAEIRRLAAFFAKQN